MKVNNQQEGLMIKVGISIVIFGLAIIFGLNQNTGLGFTPALIAGLYSTRTMFRYLQGTGFIQI